MHLAFSIVAENALGSISCRVLDKNNSSWWLRCWLGKAGYLDTRDCLFYELRKTSLVFESTRTFFSILNLRISSILFMHQPFDLLEYLYVLLERKKKKKKACTNMFSSFERAYKCRMSKEKRSLIVSRFLRKGRAC